MNSASRSEAHRLLSVTLTFTRVRRGYDGRSSYLALGHARPCTEGHCFKSAHNASSAMQVGRMPTPERCPQPARQIDDDGVRLERRVAAAPGVRCAGVTHRTSDRSA
jgi:hypothetical protein